MEVKYKNGVASVIINELFPEDGGKYTCKATNTKGSVETSSKVIIIPMEKKAVNGATNGTTGPIAPRVFKHVQSATVKDGEPVTLRSGFTMKRKSSRAKILSTNPQGTSTA